VLFKLYHTCYCTRCSTVLGKNHDTRGTGLGIKPSGVSLVQFVEQGTEIVPDPPPATGRHASFIKPLMAEQRTHPLFWNIQVQALGWGAVHLSRCPSLSLFFHQSSPPFLYWTSSTELFGHALIIIWEGFCYWPCLQVCWPS
jgi:hypothetical protein